MGYLLVPPGRATVAQQPRKSPAQVGISFPNPQLQTGKGCTWHQEDRVSPCAQGMETPAGLHTESVAKVAEDLLAFLRCDCGPVRQSKRWAGGAEQQKSPCSCTRCPGGGHAAEAPRMVLCLVFCRDSAR